LRALQRFGIEAELSGRNDIIIEGPDGPRKISGSAFRETRDRAFHHGTLLINADLDCLANYLTPHPKKLQSKGRASVRARVMNLAELNSAITHEALSEAVIEEFFASYGARVPIEILDPQGASQESASLTETFAHFASWDWRFGHAPQFQQQLVEYLSWGFLEIHIDCNAGIIERAQVFSDALFPDFIDAIEVVLQGKTFSKRGIERAAEELLVLQAQMRSEINELKQWLFAQVETT
jgi:lipoate-protein ligase A